ncbi:SREC-like protein [Mya arenaria]|uniref:SREC-like protein n=1 Tax=Mya arenaria TaxID=6604 RepID=A0ABY7DQC6_MYAAR|nr:SREC-like protein [Mya arenaria]
MFGKPWPSYIVSYTDCSAGYFGDKCLRRCHCKSPCDALTGNCNVCEPGLTTCEDGKYGKNCIMSCGKCRPNKICDKVSGICPNGCTMGFKGTTCLEREKEERRFTASEVAGMAGGSVGGCLLLVGLAHVSVLLINTNLTPPQSVCRMGPCPPFGSTWKKLPNTIEGWLTQVATIVPPSAGNQYAGLHFQFKQDYISIFKGFQNHFTSKEKSEKQLPNLSYHVLTEEKMNKELKRILVLMIWNIFADSSVLATLNPVYGSADQSSQYSNCSADKAFDGVKIFIYLDEDLLRCTCSVTGEKSFPRWWEMDFGSMHLIGLFIVTGRIEVNVQSTNLTAFISNNTMETNKSTQVNSSTGTTVGLHVRLDPPRIAQYINIKKEDTIDVMTICEVEVFESNCEMGYFGDKCLRRCHCKGPCDVLSGNCNECDPGWYPPTCETACEDGTYGTNCNMKCGDCFPNKICDKLSGICPNGCMVGFKGTTCSEPEKEERRFTASEVAGMAAGSVGCCLLLVGLVHVCVLVYRRYKSASTKRDSTYVIP